MSLNKLSDRAWRAYTRLVQQGRRGEAVVVLSLWHEWAWARGYPDDFGTDWSSEYVTAVNH